MDIGQLHGEYAKMFLVTDYCRRQKAESRTRICFQPFVRNYSYLNLITPTVKNIAANPSKTPASGNISIKPPPRSPKSSMPSIAQVVGSILTADCIAGGNSSSGYMHPPNMAKSMPNMMLNPLACPAVLMSVPNVVPNAAAASADVNRMMNNARGSRPQASFIAKIPNPTNRNI